MHDTTLEVAIVADVSDVHIAISSVYQCETGPLWHEHSSLPLDVLDSRSDWSTNSTALESWRFVVDYELRCQSINYYDIL